MARGAATWPPFEVTSLRHNLGILTALVEDRERVPDPDVRAWLARLLVVRSAGFIEQSVQECCRGYVAGASGGWVKSFAHSWLERAKNPSPENLVGLIGRFDQSLADEFEAYMSDDDELRFRDLSFLIDRRNKIAHGVNESVNPRRAMELAATSVEVVDWFVLRMNPNR